MPCNARSALRHLTIRNIPREQVHFRLIHSAVSVSHPAISGTARADSDVGSGMASESPHEFEDEALRKATIGKP